MGIVVLVALLSNYLIDPLVATGIAAIALAFWITTNGFTVPGLALRLTAIPVALTVLGIAMGLDRPAYDIAKDVWYFLMPAFALVFGAVAARVAPTPRPLLMGFLAAGTLLSAIFLGGIATDIEILTDTDVDAIRSEIGAGYFPTVFALLILLTIKSRLTPTQAPMSRPAVIAAWTVNGLALILSFSRTMWFVFLIGLIMQSGALNLRRALLWMLAAGIGLALVAIPLGNLDSGNDELVLSVVEKITRSLAEMIPQAHDSESDVNINWRGYESLMGLRAYFSGNLPQLVFGQGFGALVDLGFSIKLGESEFRYIPILHNSYIYLLVKVGAVGFLGYLVWLYKILKVARSNGRSESRFSMEATRLAQVLVLVILFTTLVVSGVFNKYNVLPLMTLLGATLVFATSGPRSATRRMPAQRIGGVVVLPGAVNQ